jgi:hypothetical protein
MDRLEIELALRDGIFTVSQIAENTLAENKIQFSVEAGFDELFINQPAVILTLTYEGHYCRLSYHVEKLAQKYVGEMIEYDIRQAVHKFIERVFLK